MAAFCAASYLKGREHVQAAWDAAITEQATRSANQVIAEARSAAAAETRYIKAQSATKERITIVEKKVVEYVQAPTQRCAVDRDFVGLLDAASLVYNDGLNRVPTTDPNPSQPQELSGGAITSAEVLQAYHAAIEQLTGYRDAYQALVQYEEGREIVQQSYAVGGR